MSRQRALHACFSVDFVLAHTLAKWQWRGGCIGVLANLVAIENPFSRPIPKLLMGHSGGMGEHMTFRKFLRVAAVCDALGVSRATFYRMVRDGQFPRPVQLTAQVRVWPAEVVASWMDAKVQEAMKTPT